MEKIEIKGKSLPKLCEICHQWDYIDVDRNYCLRCANTSNTPQLQAKDNISLSTIRLIGKMLRTARKSPRLIAGLWFATSGIIPVAFYLSVQFHEYIFERLHLDIIIYYIVIPVLIAGVFGSLLGSSIINGQMAKSSIHAAQRGFLIAVLSLVLYIIIYTLILSPPLSLERIIENLFFMLFFAGILVGWLVGIVGITAGLLLYKLSKNKKEV
jgi:hypothetical protein